MTTRPTLPNRQPRKPHPLPRMVADSQRTGYGWHMGYLTEAVLDAVKRSGQTPYAIAKGSGVARSQLSRMLRGQSGMTADTIERLADYLGLRVTIEPKRKTTKGR